MAVVQIDPQDWSKANVVQIDSDAPDNAAAIENIERWAAEHGFARTNEYWLRMIHRKDGTKVFRGVCYRITAEIEFSNDAELQQIAERAARHPYPSNDE